MLDKNRRGKYPDKVTFLQGTEGNKLTRILSLRTIVLPLLLACLCTSKGYCFYDTVEAPLCTSNSLPTASQPISLEYTVASIHQENRNDGKWRAMFTPTGYTASGVSLLQLIEEACGIFSVDRYVNLPKWANTARFDLEARVAIENQEEYSKLNLGQRRLLLRKLLASRFGLVLKSENRLRPVYLLQVASGGPRLVTSSPTDKSPLGASDAGGSVTRARPGQFTVTWETMRYFAQYLSDIVDRIVIDDTGLQKHYDFSLDWQPDPGSEPPQERNGPLTTGGPTIFTALKEQLGLQLKPGIKPVPDVVIANVSEPTLN